MVKTQTYQVATATSKPAEAGKEIFMRVPFDGIHTMTQKFGEHANHYKQFGLLGHEGIDWSCPEGTPVLAAESGHVVKRDFSAKDYGNVIIIWHQSHNLATWYGHLKSCTVSGGAYVEKGEQIGVVGNSGVTQGTHLHFGLCETDDNGQRIYTDNGYHGFIDPEPYLETRVGTRSHDASDDCVYEGTSTTNSKKEKSFRSHFQMTAKKFIEQHSL